MIQRLAFVAFVLFGFVVPLAAEPPTLRLWLRDGSFVDGTLQPSQADGLIGLSTPVFDQPIDLDIRGVRSVAGDYSPELPKTGHSFLLEGGTRIAGKLKAWDATSLVVQSKSLGEITIQRSLLRAVEAIEDAGKRIYSGPKSIDDWQVLDDTGKWKFAAGALTSPDNDAKAASQVDLPQKFRLSLSMSWEGRADFVLSLGCKKPKKPQPKQENRVRRAMVQPTQESAAVRLEMWDAQLAVVREVGNLADIAVLPLDDGISKFNLTFYVDQLAGLVAVYSPRGKMLEKIQVAESKGSVNPYAMLENHGKSVSLDQFDVYEWDGHLPDSTEYPDGYVLTKEDKVIAAHVVNFDTSESELNLINADKKTSSVAIDDVRRIIIVGSDSKEKKSKTNKEDEGKDESDDESEGDDESDAAESESGPQFESIELDETRLIEVEFADASRLVGYVKKAAADQFRFCGNGLLGTFGCDAEQIVAISGSGKPFTPAKLPGVAAWLHTEKARVQGCLVDSQPGKGSVLMFQPYASESRVAISTAFSGELKFRDRRNLSVKQSKIVPLPAQPRPSGLGKVLSILGGKNGKPTDEKHANTTRQFEIVFRSGDTVNGVIQAVDQKGVTFESSATTTTFVPHDKMDSITLGRMISKPNFDEEELKRLLTVPRSNKNDPPTHLFVSTTGDYLRGRLVGISADTVGVEVRLQVQNIPRQNVARVIWLHDRPWLEEKEEKAAEDTKMEEPKSEFLVHAVRPDKRGVTFAPMQLKQGVLSGVSELLGDCSVELTAINSLFYGSNVGDKALALRKESWKLSLAALPKAYLETPEGDAATNLGTQSPLVGKNAPEITLQTIDDVEFVLSENQDKVIVLDFWASWCGPCIATMPKVDAIVQKYDPRKVELVAVNLQDSVAKARIALKRMEIEPTVVMDVDGEAAQFYDARAIPQTVIVDTNGKITHLFVGGGSKFLAQFEAALNEVVGEPKE